MSEQVYSCMDCSEAKGQSGFYKKQWVLKGQGARCKPCWDAFIRQSQKKRTHSLTEEQHQKAPAKKKTKTSERPERNKAELEWMMKVCRSIFGVPYDGDVAFKNDDDDDEEDSDSDDDKEFDEDAIKKKKNEIIYEDLVGSYHLIFYVSSRFCYDPDPQSLDDWENISRTARDVGGVELSMKTWGDKPALYGCFKMDRGLDSSSAFGDRPAWSFIQHVGDHDCPINKGSSDQSFLAIDVNGYDWWTDLSEDSYDYKTDHPRCAELKVIQTRVALPLSTDSVSEFLFSRKRPDLPAQNSLDAADKRMSAYRDVSKSWTCNHLGFPIKVATLIREYVSPPPFFFLEPGDVVLSVDEADECEWEKRFVFRRISSTVASSEGNNAASSK